MALFIIILAALVITGILATLIAYSSYNIMVLDLMAAHSEHEAARLCTKRGGAYSPIRPLALFDEA